MPFNKAIKQPIMSKTIQIGIVGGAGYTAGELLRILLHHPAANIAFVHSKSHAGQPVATVHTDLIGETDLVFSNTLSNVALLFLCLGHGEAARFLAEHAIDATTKIIDLSNDFRLAANAQQGAKKFVYGLPELNKPAIAEAQHIANPGCFATAIQLALLPLANAQSLKDVYCTGITGSTGAGQSLAATSHFSWRVNNVQAYKTLTHQHMAEILQSIQSLQKAAPAIHFVPWRGDFARGIFVSAQTSSDQRLDELNSLYKNFYANSPFVVVSEAPISMKQVVNSNKCVLQLEKLDNQLVVHAAIDNLLKGASGQAVQNMNLMMGLPETTGLQLKAIGF
jgi:N-acetyl-gamma-glutamyl-phosphate reductase